MPRATYRLRLVRGSEEFEAEGDKAFVLAMLHRFEGTGGKRPVAESEERTAKLRTSLDKPSVAKPVAVGEFIRQLAPKKHTDMVLAFGYYLEKQGGMRDFTPADINRCYYDAKLEPSNTSQMITQNIKRGTMMAAKGGKGQKGWKRYTLTQTGEDKVRGLLSKVK
jgi:hypothetical protein